ncbi:MAG: imidazolonepropionase [Bradymonadaceae bacterium]
MELDDFTVRADQVLTMPESPSGLAAREPGAEIDLRDRDLTGLIQDGGVYASDGTIQWVGEWSDRPDEARGGNVTEMQANVVTPGWIDCHTHAVFAGERSGEFAMRNAGRSYSEILEAGGGILETVEAVRETSEKALSKMLFDRTFESIRRGVTTLEVKSGYGLTVEDEMKQLRAVESTAGRDVPLEFTPCLLGAHAVPESHRDRREAYVDLVCEEMIPRVAESGLAEYCDVFCDEGAFTVAEAERILLTGRDHGLTPRLHTEQLSESGGAMLAAQLEAASADHLEHVGSEALSAMADADVTPVFLPTVNVTLGELNQLAPARKALDAGCEVALATDFNPGTSMTQDLALVTHLACTLYGLTPGEALRGVTIGGAKALDRDDIGRLREGARADLALFDVPTYRYIPYHVGGQHVAGVVQDGNIAYWTETEG